MSNIIQLLPDSVANQIAAGEVIQRPASLLKELMENAIDAGADEITVIVKDAGRTLLQVIDNGSGMSETDARMAFERHATSKIKTANDLFSIRTMGFRGEALASIAAVAHVELTTKMTGSELGTKIVIAGSKVELQTPIACAKGSNFSVKNLFFNVPARRKFLKPDAVEMKNIITDFKRIVLTNKNISFKLYHNDLLLFNLPATNLLHRISGTISIKTIQNQIIPVNLDTSLVKIYGFTGNPQFAKKSGVEQYFFVNNRFMKHPYFHKAVMEAYSKLIPADTLPSYFIYFEVNPDIIDVNIHPTKTEIKFEDESTIWKILNAVIRESLGKYNAVPSIDFDTEGIIDIPVLRPVEEITAPKVHINPDFNPFENKKNSVPYNWEALYEGFMHSASDMSSKVQSEGKKTETFSILSKNSEEEFEQLSLYEETLLQNSYFQIKNRFILSPVKSGLMFIEQRRAHERILFERFLLSLNTKKSASQQLLFPEIITLNQEDIILFKEIENDLKVFGFNINESRNASCHASTDGAHPVSSFEITGIPAGIENVNVPELLEEVLTSYRDCEINPEMEIKEKIAMVMAKKGCMKTGETLSQEDMSNLVNNLFKCKLPSFSPSGKPIISILSNEELDARFK